jgi:hypothetical protein
MNKKIFSLVAALGICGSSGLIAVTTGGLLSQLSLQRGVIHYPLEGCDPEKPWQVDIWGAGYCRKACQAFMCDDCGKKGSTTATADLSKLFFGKSSFYGEEAFANGILTTPSNNPGLIFSKITPRFDYNESGVFLGLHAQKDICDTCWSIGWRASLPIKRISVQQRSSCGCEEPNEHGFGDTIVRRQEFTNAKDDGAGPKMNNVYGYRLDLLSSLQFLDGSPLIAYGDGTNDTTVAQIPVTLYEERHQVNIEKAIAPMYVLYADNGDISNAITIGTPAGVEERNNLARNVGPETPLDVAELNLWKLNSAGTNHNPNIPLNGDRLAFSRTIDYASGLALDREQQKHWFLVPNGTGASVDSVLIEEANAVQNAIDYILNKMDLTQTSAIAFFKKHGVDFTTSECVVGAGDLYTEWYLGYTKSDWYANLLIGSKIPTGKKECDAKRIYWQPTGNNGHFELRGGLEAGWHYDWFALRGLATYTHVFGHTEMRAPAFEGATIKNIPVGQSVPARVHSGYFWGNVDVTLFHPKCTECGLVVGYELYAKRHDKVCFCSSTAKDFLGFTHKLDNKILENGTDTRLHKIRGEFFYRIGCCEYFGGAYYSLAGRNALKETEFHVGAAIYF